MPLSINFLPSDLQRRRRIDLLGVDRAGHVVVVEVKRTTDGGTR
jgi:hypothetical protein